MLSPILLGIGNAHIHDCQRLPPPHILFVAPTQQSLLNLSSLSSHLRKLGFHSIATSLPLLRSLDGAFRVVGIHPQLADTTPWIYQHQGGLRCESF